VVFYGISHILLGCVNAKKIYSKKQRWDIWMNYSTNQNAEGSDGLSSMLRFLRCNSKAIPLVFYVNNIAFSDQFSI
jgi:hypothetical protein